MYVCLHTCCTMRSSPSDVDIRYAKHLAIDVLIYELKILLAKAPPRPVFEYWVFT